jgi:hypothetical protein
VLQHAARNLTALLDGASLQPGRSDPAVSDSLVDDLTRMALAVAIGS